MVDLTQSLGWIINQEKSELKPTQVFSFVGYDYHLDSALIKPSQDGSNFRICSYDSSHHMFLITRCLMSLIGLLASTEKMVPEGRLPMRPFSVSPQGALEISSVIGQPPSLDRNLFITPRMVAESHKRDERHRPSQRPHYPTLYRYLKQRLGHSLRADLYKGSVVRPGNKATHKCSRADGLFSGPSKVQGPVLKPNSVGCYRQLNSSSLHK